MPVDVRYAVHDVGTAVAFYVDLLGFSSIASCRPRGSEVVYRGHLYLHLDHAVLAGGADYPVDDARVTGAGAWNRVRLLLADLDAAVDRLRAAGVSFVTDVVTDEADRHAVLLDPSANPVELFEPLRPHPGAGDLEQQSRARARQILDDLPRNRKEGRVMFAAAAAQRAFAWHDALPAEERRAYSETWRPVLEAVWAYVAGDADQFDVLSAALARFYLSPQHHNQGQDGPSDADTDEVAATIYAAECALHGMTEFALGAASRALEAIDHRWEYVQDDQGGFEADFHAELQRQAEDLAAIHGAVDRWWIHGPPEGLIRRLRNQQRPRPR